MPLSTALPMEDMATSATVSHLTRDMATPFSAAIIATDGNPYQSAFAQTFLIDSA
jgi:hypothetical protein